MKKLLILSAMAVMALLGSLNASAQDVLTYISEVKSAYYNVVPGTGDIVINKNLNEGIEDAETHKIMYKTTDDILHNKIITDIIAVRNYSGSTITYNGVTYYKAAYQGGGSGNMNYKLKYNGKDAPSLCLYVAKAIPALGDKVLTGIDVEICESAQTSGDYVPVMEYSDGTAIPYGNNNLKNETESTFYVYLKPTYTTISYEAFPAIFMENCTEGSGTEDDPYLLSTAGHLYWFSYMVATGNEDICGKLTTDIKVNEGVLNSDGSLSSKTNLKPWFPIGYNGDHTFRGKLMGDGHTVSGLYYNDSETDIFTGLVGHGVAVTISRIGVTDSYIAGRRYVGGIIGEVVMKNLSATSTIDECFFQGTLSGTAYCGGIAGTCGNGTVISNCYASVLTLNKKTNFGGILGELGHGTQKNCYYDSDVFGSASSASGITAMTSAQFASGEVASRLNHQVETGEETFRQRIGTDKYPKFKDNNKNNYVFHTSDGGYTNQCPHVIRTQETPLQPSTCVNGGHIAYYFCDHPACKTYYADFPGSIATKANELGLLRLGDTTPVVIKDKDGYRWTRTEKQLVNTDFYYNVMNLTLAQLAESPGTYSVLYPTWPLVNGANLFCQVNMKGMGQGKITLKVLVNKVERTEYRLVANTPNCVENTFKLEDISMNDQLEIDVIFEGVKVLTTGNMAFVTIGVDKLVFPTLAEHESVTYIAGDDCLHEGLLPHFQCERCGALFAADADNPKETDTERFKTDEYVVTKDELYRPALESHLFSFAQQPNGLYADHCDRCDYIDTDSWVAKEAIDGEDLHLTGNDTDGFTTDEDITLALGKNYTVPVAFTAPTLNYSAPTYSGVWNSWGVPFEVTTTDLANAGFEAAYIEGIHRYDTDDDGQIDRTTLEVIRIKNGRLRAGTPYLIHPKGTETKIELNLADPAFKGTNGIQPIHTETALAAYDFIPTFVKIPSAEAAGKYYIVGNNNSLGFTTSHVPALDWYLNITPKDSPFDEIPAEVKSISIRVVGEEDDATGIVTRYADRKVSEEIYDLSGRRVGNNYKGIIIKNGKKYLVR